MTSSDMDALDIARRQLRALIAEEPGVPRTTEGRLQLGLLAAQIALAERLPALVGRSPGADESPEVVWDPPRLETFVRTLTPNARRCVQALCDENGSATPARLMELTGNKSLAVMTNSVHRAARAAVPGVLAPQRGLIQNVKTGAKIDRYRITADILPLLRRALTDYTAERA